jgi:hypothetical protein
VRHDDAGQAGAKHRRRRAKAAMMDDHPDTIEEPAVGHGADVVHGPGDLQPPQGFIPPLDDSPRLCALEKRR